MSSGLRLHDKTFRPFLSAQQIAERIHVLGAEMASALTGKKPLFIVVLNGAFVFAADLLRTLPLEAEVLFVQLSSYAGTASSGEVKTILELPQTLAGRHLVLVEDIVDTGRTLDYLQTQIALQSPASIQIVTFLFKPEALTFPKAQPDWIAFEIPNRFVVGYGLDYDEFGRNLPDLWVAED